MPRPHTLLSHKSLIMQFGVCFQNTFCWAKAETYTGESGVAWRSNVHSSRCLWPKKKKKKSWLSQLFPQIYTFKSDTVPGRERCGALVARWDLHVLSSPVGINGREVQCINSPTVRCSESWRQVSPPGFLIGHERQSATPVTAGHGHHHTSGTWRHKGCKSCPDCWWGVFVEAILCADPTS